MAQMTAIVATTVFENDFLGGYLDNIRDHNHRDHVTIFIIADRKTPSVVFKRSKDARRRGFDVRCPELDDQVAFLKKLGLPEGFIPWDTDNRRNVGYLMALDNGAEVVVSIDDDNFCPSGVDYVGEHLLVGNKTTEREMNSSDGWFNNCSLLKGSKSTEIFPRGFPYFARNQRRTVGKVEIRHDSVVAINAGLWVGDPDVDAVTRLALAPKITGFRGESVTLAPKVWCPISTQNTGLTRDAASVYYYVRMGYPLQGLKIDRYGDILSGYFTQKCARHLGHAVRIGSPVAEHKRTPHNLFKDLYHELAGMMIVEELLPWLTEVRLDGATYPQAYACLTDRLLEQAGRFKGFVWDEGGRDFLLETAKCMRTWLSAVRQLT